MAAFSLVLAAVLWATLVMAATSSQPAERLGAKTPPVGDDQPLSTKKDTQVAIKLTGSDVDMGDTLSFITASIPDNRDLSKRATPKGENVTTVPYVLTGDTVSHTPDTGFIRTGSLKPISGKKGRDANTVTVNVTTTLQYLEPQVQETYGKLSVSFDANQDQGDPQVKFVPRGDAFVSTGEGHGSLQFSTATYGATETDGRATITVTRTGGSDGQVMVDYATSDGTATTGPDYTATSGAITFATGDTGDQTFTILINDDALVEGNETVHLTLSNPTVGAILGSPKTAALIIAANDWAVDANQDGFVEGLDLRIVAAHLVPPPFDEPRADANGNGVVDILDLTLVAVNLGRLALRPLQAMQLERAFPNLTFQLLTNLVQPDDGHDHFFFAEQPGRIRVSPNDQGATEAKTFLDISARVSEVHNEEGLLGLAFSPDYKINGYFYVYYSATSPRRSVLSRFSVSLKDPDMADPDSEFVIIEIAQPFGNHNGGQLAFGPDGYLYIGLGDGGSGGDPLGNGQNRDTLLGSILRIDVGLVSGDKNYSVPPNNPFVGVANAREEIWAYGLRNPWRFSFDEHTGFLWLADVGQDMWEEIDIVKKGLNYGWNFMEGLHCFSPSINCNQTGLELPLWEYSLSLGNCSVIGGYVYRGRGVPSLLGAYMYGDFCSGKIWGLRYDGEFVTEQMLLVDSSLFITSFGQDLAGNLYILSRNEGIYRLVPPQ